MTWAEDRAPVGTDPSADPGAVSERRAAGCRPPSPFAYSTNAINPIRNYYLPPANPRLPGFHFTLNQDTHVHPSFIFPDIIDAVGNGLDRLPFLILFRKVMRLDLDGLSLAAPRSSRVLVFSDDFLLFRVDGEGRLPRSLLRLFPALDILKLGIPIRLLFSLNGFTVRLQAVTCILKQPGHGSMTYRVSPLLSLPGNVHC